MTDSLNATAAASTETAAAASRHALNPFMEMEADVNDLLSAARTSSTAVRAMLDRNYSAPAYADAEGTILRLAGVQRDDIFFLLDELNDRVAELHLRFHTAMATPELVEALGHD